MRHDILCNLNFRHAYGATCEIILRSTGRSLTEHALDVHMLFMGATGSQMTIEAVHS